MKNRQQLLQQLSESGRFVEEMRKEYEGKDVVMPKDVEERFDRAVNDMLDARKLIEQIDRLDSARSFMNDPAPGINPVNGKRDEGGIDDKDPLVRAWRDYLRGDMSKISHIRASQQVNPNTAGGYLVPTVLLPEIIRPIDNPIFMRQISRVSPIKGNAEIPRQTNRGTAYWQGETEAATPTSVTVGQSGFRPNRLTVKTSSSRLLIDQGVINVESWLGEELDYDSRLKEEQAFMQGTGVGQPLGVFTASADGISTARDYVSASSGVIAPADILGAFFNNKATVRNRGSWVGSRAFVAAVAGMKDTAGQYIFTESYGIGNVLSVGTPMMLKGRPLYESEDAPSTLAAGTYAAVFGDYAYYRIYDFLMLSIQVLDQDPYASAGELGYVMHKYLDGGPVLEEAFTRLQVKP